MARVNDQQYDFRLENNSSMICSGPSKCGKSSFVTQMIEKKDVLFKHPIRQVWWYYGVRSEETHQKLQSLGVHLKQGVPSSEEFDAIGEHDLLVLDDLQDETEQNKNVTSLFMKHSHHKNYFVIQIQQHIFGDKQQRVRNLNVHYYVCFRNARDSMQNAQFLGRMYPSGQKVIQALFQRLHAKEGNYTYLFVDFTQETQDDLRLRSHLFTLPLSVYKVTPPGDISEWKAIPSSSSSTLSSKTPREGEPITNYSTMVLVPKVKYDSMLGGATKEQVRAMLNPQRGYAEQRARELIDYKLTPDTMRDYLRKLIQFDSIRRNFMLGHHSTLAPTPPPAAAAAPPPVASKRLEAPLKEEKKSEEKKKKKILGVKSIPSPRGQAAIAQHLSRLRKHRPVLQERVNTRKRADPFTEYSDTY